jgi:hypothetical protein
MVYSPPLVAKRRSTTSGAGHPSTATPRQSPIEAALERGDIRMARRLASAAASSAPTSPAPTSPAPAQAAQTISKPSAATPSEAERAAAKGVLERTRPDPAALVVAAVVLVVIVLAAWLALFRVH